MEQSFVKRLLGKIGIAIIAVVLSDLLYLNYWVLKNDRKEVRSDLRSQKLIIEASPSPSSSGSQRPGVSEEKIASASPAPRGEPSPIIKTETVVQNQTQTIIQTAQKEIFIPIGSGSTFSHDYADLSGLEVTIDTTKYSAIDSVVFEGSVWVQDGNGKMYTQLYNKSDGRPVWNSEIYTSSRSGVMTTSGKITLENGQRTYKVQAKTNLTEYAAHVDGARIKITLK